MTITVPAGRYSDFSTAFVQAYIDQSIGEVVGLAPETLNSLQELSAALGDDPAFFATVAAQVSELNTDVTDVVAALGVAENDSEMGTFTSPVLPDGVTLKAVLEAFAAAYSLAKTSLEDADTALSGRLDTLEGDPTTQTLVDAGDASTLASANTYTDTAVAGVLDLAPGTLDTLNELAAAIGDDADFIGTVNASIQAVQDDVDQNEIDSDAADSALSGRLDTLEADPTTQTAVDAKLNIANPAATGDLTVDTQARLEFDSNLTKLHNDLRGTSIVIGNNITLNPAAADGRVEIEGEFYLRPSDLTDAADDTAAAAAGIIVGQVYRNGSQLMVRVS
jgi:hypothetical protein